MLAEQQPKTKSGHTFSGMMPSRLAGRPLYMPENPCFCRILLRQSIMPVYSRAAPLPLACSCKRVLAMSSG